MTDESRGLGGTVGPPWSVDVLADLHAGVLDEREAAELWPRVNADAEARAIIEALEATTADLNALGSAPVEPMPAEFAARLDAAIASEAQRTFGGQAQQAPVAPVVDLAARRKRNKLLGWGTGLVAAAAAAVVAVAVLVPGGQGGSGSDVAQPPPTSQPGGEPPLALKKNDLGPALGGPQGVRDLGPLGSEEKLDACLTANGIDPSLRPVKVRPVTFDGKPGVMVLFTTGKLAQFRLVILSPTCGPNEPGKLLDELIGKK